MNTSNNQKAAASIQGLDEQIVTVAKRSRDYFAKRSHTARASLDDVEQVAALAAVVAAKSFDPTQGTAFSSYAFTCAYRQVGAFLWSQSAIHAPPKKLSELRETTGVEYDDGLHVSPDPTPEANLGRRRWEESVRRQLRHLLSDTEQEVLLRVVVKEQNTTVVANDLGLPARTVRQAFERAREVLQGNAMMFELWREQE